MTSRSFSSVVTLCVGTTPLPRAAVVISHFARATSGWSNWPGLRIAAPGIAPWCPETKSIKPKSSDSTPGVAAISQTSCKCAEGFDQDMDRDFAFESDPAFDTAQVGHLRMHVLDAARLGQGDERQARAGNADDDLDVLLPVRMREIMDAGGDSAVPIVAAHDDAGGHLGVFALGTGMGTILAIAGDVKDRSQFVLQAGVPSSSVFPIRRNGRRRA